MTFAELVRLLRAHGFELRRQNGSKRFYGKPGFPGLIQRSLHGLRVVAFETRRAAEMAELIRRHGGEPILAPSIREVPLDDTGELIAYLSDLEAGRIDVVLLMTGVGLRTLAKAVASSWPLERLAIALQKAQLVARGPKPVAALREIGLQPNITVPEPNTWREMLATLDARLPVAGKRVAVQEYGMPNQDLLHGLEARGASVQRVPIYRWALPDDLDPLRAAIRALVDGAVDVALFTSATQIYHLFRVAHEQGAVEPLRAGLAAAVIGSIGPVCSDALREHGLTPDLEPAHPKMGQLVGEMAKQVQDLRRLQRAT
jgi:uroporphyrinogen-III synthase